jgi:hypothetical protein
VKDLKDKWKKHKPTIAYLGALAAVGGVCVALIANMSSKDVRDRLQAENKRLEEEVAESDALAWDYHDFSMALLAKLQPSPAALEASAESWRNSKTLAF